MAKAVDWADTDTQRRKLEEQIGLDTLVVLAVNNGNYVIGQSLDLGEISAVANALSFPPGEYARKGETQRN